MCHIRQNLALTVLCVPHSRDSGPSATTLRPTSYTLSPQANLRLIKFPCTKQLIICTRKLTGRFCTARNVVVPFASRELPTQTKVESGTSQSKSGTSLNSSYSGVQGFRGLRLRKSGALVRCISAVGGQMLKFGAMRLRVQVAGAGFS